MGGYTLGEMDDNIKRIATGKPQVALEPCSGESCLHRCTSPLSTHLVVAVGDYGVVVTLDPESLTSLKEVVDKMAKRIVKL